MNLNSVLRLLAPIALLAALTACGEDPKPAASNDTKAAEETAAAPAEAPRPTPAPVQAAEPPPPVPQVTTLPPDMIGSQPPKHIQDAFVVANQAMDEYAREKNWPRKEFYVKESLAQGPNYKVVFFGQVGTEGYYIVVIVYPDGHVDISK